MLFVYFFIASLDIPVIATQTSVSYAMSNIELLRVKRLFHLQNNQEPLLGGKG